LLPKSENTPEGFSHHRYAKLLVVLLFLTSSLFLYGSYFQQKHQIGLLISEMQMQMSYQKGLEMRIQNLEAKLPLIEESLDKIKAMTNDMKQHQDHQIHELSEKLVKSEEFFESKDADLKSQMDQTRNSLGSYVKSEDFFQISNGMVETSRKKFKQISEELNQIQVVLQSPQFNADDDGDFGNFQNQGLEEEEESIGKIVGELKSKIYDGAEKIKELSKSTLTHATKSIEKVKDLTGENLGIIKGFVMTNTEKIKEFSKNAGEKMEPIKEKVSEQVQHMKEGVQKISKDLGEKAKNFAKKFF